MKSIFPLLLSLAAGAQAATTLSPTFVVSTAIPDNSLLGIADTRAVTSDIHQITRVEIALTLTGGWNGDLYAYLSHAGGFTVLLNRPGRSLVMLDGSGTADMAVVFSDTATLDIHTMIPASGAVTGIYQPDARNVDPGTVLDTSPRSAFLDSFAGLDPNGDWTLFIADVSPGGTTVLQSWTMTVTGIPEPATGLLAATGGLLLLRRRRIHRDFDALSKRPRSRTDKPPSAAP